jgi:hypothetical protein
MRNKTEKDCKCSPNEHRLPLACRNVNRIEQG